LWGACGCCLCALHETSGGHLPFKRSLELRLMTKNSFFRRTAPLGRALAIAALLNASTDALGNNLQMGAPTVNTGASTITFTISWANSWFVTGGPANWDGVWLFVKRQSCSDRLWNHALLSTVDGDHAVTGGLLTVDAVADGMGVFVHRTNPGQGDIPTSTVTLRLQTAPNNVDNFRVFGIEMVNIPQGEFLIGDGGQSCGNTSFCSQLITATTQANGIGAAANYVCISPNWGSSGNLPATFPLGFNRFYAMKYEVSQEQYVGFLNCLTFTQQVARTHLPPNSAVGGYAMVVSSPISRNGIRIAVSGLPNSDPAVYGCDLNANGTMNDADDGQNVACNWLGWRDLAAYLDWAALRPITEFEYEKLCRGTAAVAAFGEYAWSNLMLTQVSSASLLNAGQAGEVPTTTGPGLCAAGWNNSGTLGPLRCGFAATGATLRVASGSGFYGVMDLTGNVWEQCIGGNNGSNYGTFTAASGDGSLAANGNANTTGWPANGGANNGSMVRGGAWNTDAVGASNRGYVACAGGFITLGAGRDRGVGGRGGRSW